MSAADSASLYEKLGAFYLGRDIDADSGETGRTPTLLAAKDLTTHGVIIGMTGSGKTGLGISLLEEAAIDGIPVIAIDPKGDLGNLLLTFPELRAEDFAPWVDAGAAAAAGKSAADFAAAQAALWRKGLAEWDQDGDRIARLKAAADFALYTPGSRNGRPLAMLGKLAPPAIKPAADPDAFAQSVSATASGLLGLIGEDGDAASPEAALLAQILDHHWRAGQTLDLAALIAAIQTPPFQRLGVLPLESFFPQPARSKLALRFNAVLASPGFAGWLEGEPLSASSLLFTAEGRPRVSVIHISHLDDAARMFVVSQILSAVIDWMRTQPGTGSLRALLYMDEVFGYLPPNGNPPSKPLLLTLLKQARAFGVGAVLSTQNPVDLDYKALSNAGTWCIGRLQTRQDRERVMAGLLSAQGGLDRDTLDGWMAGLGKRRFLLHSIHGGAPRRFATRWAMSYLAGPLSRQGIARLCAEAPAPADATPAAATRRDEPPPTPAASPQPPLIPAGIACHYLPPRQAPKAGESLLYRPLLLAGADIAYQRARPPVAAQRRLLLALAPSDGPVPVDWQQAEALDPDWEQLADSPLPGAEHAEIPPLLLDARAYGRWSTELARCLRQHWPLTLLQSADPKAVSQPGESEGAFRARLRQMLAEARDQQTAQLQQRFEKRAARLAERIASAEAAVAREDAQRGQQTIAVAASVGSALLGAFFGNRRLTATSVRRAGSAARAAGRLRKEDADLALARDKLAALRAEEAELARAFEAAAAELRELPEAGSLPLDRLAVRARSSDISLRFVALGWQPWYRSAEGGLRAA